MKNKNDMKKSPLSPLPPVPSASRPRPSLTSLASVKIGTRRPSLLSLLAPVSLLLFTGCQVLTYRSATGERFTRSSLGANTSVSSLTVEADTNGVRRVQMRGYQNDTSQALGTVTEAAVRAAIQGVKP